MTRSFVHAIFATLALVCAGFAVHDGIQLQRAARVNRAIAAAATDARENLAADEPPQVLLAHANALSKAGQYDSAARLYESLIHDYPDDPGRTALFDLGNMYLREGRGDGASHGVRSLAMIGEAKTRYRLLLRSAPDDWDARYNLERALWLAPEMPVVLDQPDVKEQHNVKLRGAQSQDLP